MKKNDISSNQHERIGAVLNEMDAVCKLIREARHETQRWYEVSIDWIGGELTEEQQKEAKRKAYVAASGALEVAELRLTTAMELLSFGSPL